MWQAWPIPTHYLVLVVSSVYFTKMLTEEEKFKFVSPCMRGQRSPNRSVLLISIRAFSFFFNQHSFRLRNPCF